MKLKNNNNVKEQNIKNVELDFANKIYDIDNSLCLQNIIISPLNKNTGEKVAVSAFYDDYRYQIGRFYKPITKFLFIVFLSLFALYSNGQTKMESPYSIGEITKFDYKAYLKLKNMNSIYSGSDMERNYNELISVLESRYGKYIESANRMEQYWVKSKQNLTEHFPNIKVVQMSKIIDSLISQNQVTMINEIHNQPVFRSIAYSFLETCYKNGYRYFAVETLKRTDGTLNKRKYPLLYETGFYTDEPVFGDLLRQAMNIGYTLVPYDTFPSPSSSINRDQGQALNIINKTIARDSTAKILVLGGMGHIFDKEGFNTMGYYFKEYSNIDPLTINFLYFKPRFNKEDEGEAERCFLDIADNLDGWEPVFLYDTIRKQFRGIGTDFIGVIPRTVFLANDIPSWKIFNGKVIYHIDKSFLQKHNIKKSLVRAFLEKEGEKSVPIDQIEIQDTNNEIALVLYKGKYLLHFDDGKTVKKFKITVK